MHKNATFFVVAAKRKTETKT